MYILRNNRIYFDSRSGDCDLTAICDEPGKAMELLNQSVTLNNAGHYTASARKIYAAEQLPGFLWVNPL